MNLHATIALLQAAKQLQEEQVMCGINSRKNLPPVFPTRARRNLQSWGQQFQLNEVVSLLDSV